MAGPAIELTALSKRYGPIVGIDQLDLCVEAGEVFGFLGPNGAGKTTTIRCLAGLLTPSSGSVRVLGCDPIGDHRQLAPRIGYLPGELRLYGELTGAQHLKFLADLQSAPTPRRAELCERLMLTATDLGKPVQSYSHGTKQKLGLVQAFQHDPQLVILDEPTEGLDPLVQEAFFQLLADTAKSRRTVFLSSHILPEVQRACPRVAIVRAGRLVAMQTVASLRAARVRRVRLTLPAGYDHGRLPADERWSPQWAGSQLQLLLAPDELVTALRSLLAHPVVDVTVEEAGLDEAFLDFYRHSRPQAQALA
jgi:ABC-2 type transport system ATP-binding protein